MKKFCLRIHLYNGGVAVALPVVAGSLLLGFTAILGIAPGAQAAVLPVTDATYTGAVTPGTPENITGDTTLTGLTTSEGTFTNLIGATANAVVTANTLSSIGTVPANANVAVTGLSANDGVNNLQTGNFQFGTSFNANTRFFILEGTPQSSTLGDPTDVTLIDAANNAVGTLKLTLVPTDWTSSPANTTNSSLATITYAVGQGNLTQKLGAVTFSLADFSGTGNASLATGISLVSPGGAGGSNRLDPNVVGLFVVPEPSTYALVLGSLGTLLLFRRGRA
jgi:hypothetical protein